MGGKPLSALQLVSWPRDDLSFEILSEVLNGGLEIMNQASCTIIGGTVFITKDPRMVLPLLESSEKISKRRQIIKEGKF